MLRKFGQAVTQPHLPWRFHQGGFWNVVLLRTLRQPSLRAKIRQIEDGQKPDITVAITVRNRCDHRIVNFCKSIRNQDYDQDLIKLMVIDYDGNPQHVPIYKRVCDRFDARLIRLTHQPEFNKGHGINIAIRHAETMFFISADVDLILRHNYITEGLRLLREDPLRVIYSNFFETYEGDVTGEIDVVKEYDRLLKGSHHGGFNPGTCLTYTYFYQRVRGYDEAYVPMFHEDNDLRERFEALGLRPQLIQPGSSFIHQWHPSLEGEKTDWKKKHSERNLRYFEQMTSIVRNDENWGTSNPSNFVEVSSESTEPQPVA